VTTSAPSQPWPPHYYSEGTVSDDEAERASRKATGGVMPGTGLYAKAPLSPSRICVLRRLKRASVGVLIAGGVGFVLWFLLHTSLTRAFFPAWLGTAVVVASVVTGVAVLLLGYAGVTLSSHGVTRPDGPPWHLQPSTPLTLLSAGATTGLCVWLTFGLDTVAPAMVLGGHPARSTADTVKFVPATCLRCEDQLLVSFGTSAGRVVTVRMPGSSFVPVSVGDSLVYDEQSPARVTTERAWVAGRTNHGSTIVPLVAITVLVGFLVWRARRRRVQFGDLRPGVAVTSVEHVRAAATVHFADGVSVTYVVTDALGEALASKIIRDGLASVT
jgi:hypothetical protein